MTVSSSGGRVNATPGKVKVCDAKMEEEREALDLAADWADISQGLRKDLGQQLHSQWIKPIQLGSFCKETGTLDLFLVSSSRAPGSAVGRRWCVVLWPVPLLLWLTGAPLQNPKPGTYNTAGLDQVVALHTKQYCRQPSLTLSIDAGTGFLSRTGTMIIVAFDVTQAPTWAPARLKVFEAEEKAMPRSRAASETVRKETCSAPGRVSGAWISSARTQAP